MFLVSGTSLQVPSDICRIRFSKLFTETMELVYIYPALRHAISSIQLTRNPDGSVW